MSCLLSRYAVVAALFQIVLSPLANAAETDVRMVVRQTTPEGVEYGLWGDRQTTPAATLFVLATTIEATLGNPYYRQCGNELEDLGYLLVSIDLPCHGSQSVAGEPAGLDGWSHRAGMDVDFVADSNARLSHVLDELIATGVTDADRVAVGGTSRGGFLALHFAAHDPRVKCAAAFAPVTDLTALTEFESLQEQPFVAQLGLLNQVDKLAGRPVWIVIGDRDARVGTQHAIDLARHLSAVAQERATVSHVELLVMSEPRGHSTPPGSSKHAADWIRRQLSAVSP